MEGRWWDPHLFQLLLGVCLDRERQLDLGGHRGCQIRRVAAVDVHGVGLLVTERSLRILVLAMGQGDLLGLARGGRLLRHECVIHTLLHVKIGVLVALKSRTNGMAYLVDGGGLLMLLRGEKCLHAGRDSLVC